MSCPGPTPALVINTLFLKRLFIGPPGRPGDLTPLPTPLEGIKVRIPLATRVYHLSLHRCLPLAPHFNDGLNRTVPVVGLDLEGLRPPLKWEAVRDEGA
jgi:hypothetical protein